MGTFGTLEISSLPTNPLLIFCVAVVCLFTAINMDIIHVFDLRYRVLYPFGSIRIYLIHAIFPHLEIQIW